MADQHHPPSAEIAALLREDRLFPPTEDWKTRANAIDPSIYDRALDDPEGFWAAVASELEWMRSWDRVLHWNPPYARWFVGGRLKVRNSCLRLSYALNLSIAFGSITAQLIDLELQLIQGRRLNFAIGRALRIGAPLALIFQYTQFGRCMLAIIARRSRSDHQFLNFYRFRNSCSCRRRHTFLRRPTD